MEMFARLPEDDWLGVRFALNVFIGTTALRVLLKLLADTNPLWAIASMVAASEPVVKSAVRMFRARIINVLVGCVVGLAVLVLGGTSEWKLPLAMSHRRLRLVVCGAHPDHVAAGADHRRHRHRCRPEPSLEAERGRAWSAQGCRGHPRLLDGPLCQLANVLGLAGARTSDEGGNRS